MCEPVLDATIRQRFQADAGPVTHFEWHGGEPTLAGLDFYRTVVELQRRHRPDGREVTNGLQTNGLLIDDEWVDFLAQSRFRVGLSIDGPPALHDAYRVQSSGVGSHRAAGRALARLARARVPCDVLCVVHAKNVHSPRAVLGYFRDLGARSIQLLPLVERSPGGPRGVSERTATAEAIGDFFCELFDEWIAHDVGTLTVQLFEEALRPLLGLPHALCVFRETCGEVAALEHNGDLFACDHFVDDHHRLGNILNQPLSDLLDSPAMRSFGQAKHTGLAAPCLACDVRAFCNGGCPKDRLVALPDGQGVLSYLCPAYRRFFRHSRPLLGRLAGHIEARLHPSLFSATTPAPTARSVGPNQPCPCGSGRKYKRCCRP